MSNEKQEKKILVSDLLAEIRLLKQRIVGYKQGGKSVPGLMHFKVEQNLETGGYEFVPLAEAGRRFREGIVVESDNVRGVVDVLRQSLELNGEFARMMVVFQKLAERKGVPVEGGSVEDRLVGLERTLEQLPDFSKKILERVETLEEKLKEESDEEEDEQKVVEASKSEKENQAVNIIGPGK